MKKLIVLLAASFLTVSVTAKSLKDLFIAMPDSLMPTLNKNLRTELIELRDMGVKPEVKNLLSEDCLLDTLTSDYLQLATSQSSLMQMRLLPQEHGDSLLCVVKTCMGPEKESEVIFFDQEWKAVDARKMFDKDIYSLKSYLKEKPDTMSEEKYQAALALLQPMMLSAMLSPSSEMIEFKLSQILLSKEEKEQTKAILLQRKFKWDGNRFNEI